MSIELLNEWAEKWLNQSESHEYVDNVNWHPLAFYSQWSQTWAQSLLLQRCCCCYCVILILSFFVVSFSFLCSFFSYSLISNRIAVIQISFNIYKESEIRFMKFSSEKLHKSHWHSRWLCLISLNWQVVCVDIQWRTIIYIFFWVLLLCHF